jgi:FkbM family methyltransferase
MQGFFPQPNPQQPPQPPAPSLAQLEAMIQQVHHNLMQEAAFSDKRFREFQTHLVSMRQRLYGLEVREKMRDQGRTPRIPLEFRSQFGEDLLLFDLLGDKPDGLLIEVGAFDGKHLSVTYAMDALGWDCLLIEAIPQRFEQCKANRPHARVVHAALSHDDAPKEVEFTVTEDHWGGMLSYLTASEQHKQAVASQQVRTTKVRVPCTTMNDLLKDHQGEIAAASIDVEGGEVDLLRGFDLARFRPRILLLEDQSQADDTPVAQYMKTQPYTFAGWLPHSRMFFRNDQPELLRKLEAVG